MDGFYEFVRSLWVVWLMAVFVGIVAWAYWPGNKRKLQRNADIIFHDDSGHEERR